MNHRQVWGQRRVPMSLSFGRGRREANRCHTSVKKARRAPVTRDSTRASPVRLQCARAGRTGAGIPTTVAGRASLATGRSSGLCSLIMDASSVFFVSDAHLGVDPADREAARTARLHDFLNSLVGRAASLYIVGDLFDFWFEYRTAIPRAHFHTLAALRDVRAAGIEITYLNGNHDFWLGPFLSDDLGVRTDESQLNIDLTGHRLLVRHCDGLIW